MKGAMAKIIKCNACLNDCHEQCELTRGNVRCSCQCMGRNKDEILADIKDKMHTLSIELDIVLSSTRRRLPKVHKLEIDPDLDPLPDKLYRHPGGMVFHKNEDDGTYTMEGQKEEMPTTYFRYSYDRLMDTGVFSQHPPDSDPSE